MNIRYQIKWTFNTGTGEHRTLWWSNAGQGFTYSRNEASRMVRKETNKIVRLLKLDYRDHIDTNIWEQWKKKRNFWVIHRYELVRWGK
jgi:hypothetical protein